MNMSGKLKKDLVPHGEPSSLVLSIKLESMNLKYLEVETSIRSLTAGRTMHLVIEVSG
jgi:hypothetical protein